MPFRRTTAGQLLLEQILPPELYGPGRILDKKGLNELLRELAQRHPEDYARVSHQLLQLGEHAAYTTGGMSFGLKHLRQSPAAAQILKEVQQQLGRVLADDSLDDNQREAAILKLTGGVGERLQKAILEEGGKEDNPLARQVQSGSRGNAMNLASLKGGDVLYTDHRDRALPVPVLHSYSQGLRPAEYWAGTYGARKGVLATKFAVAEAGDLGKQLNRLSHRLLVTALDAEQPSAEIRGLPVETGDPDNEGALLARSAGGYPRNTVLTAKILGDLHRQGLSQILVRSPTVGGAEDGSLYARDVGVREFGRLPSPGEQPGMVAAQALGEPLSQGTLGARHSGGVAGAEKTLSGFDFINALVQSPQHFPGGATHAQVDGRVQRIEPVPAGGQHVWIDDKKHFVPPELPLKVKPGDQVEAGDVLSEGTPSPAEITRHKGIGEGRRYFAHALRDAMHSAGLKSHRRNTELIARGLINHVRLTDEAGDAAPDDVIPYQTLEHRYEPREGSELLPPKRALGQYLERPALHYTIGTRVRPSMLPQLERFGIDSLHVHRDPPPFEPEFVRGANNLAHDPDWMTRMYGIGLKGSLLESVHRGGTSDEKGTSFVPALARAVDFGHVGLVRTPHAD